VEFEFDEDQQLLQRMVRETVAKSRSLPEEQLWATYLDLGWLEAPPVELAIVLEELGYAADPTPFLATATWFAPLAGRLPRGSGTGVFDGAGRFVLDADRADEIALVTHSGVVVLDGSQVHARRLDVFDPTLHLAHVDAPDLAPGVPDLALMGLAISTVGSCRRILDLVVGHVKQRVQFGRPIGSFQAVKHACADMHVAISVSRQLVSAAVEAVAADRPDTGVTAAMAKSYTCSAAVDIVGKAMQLHGGIGYTWESDIHVYLKRAALNRSLFGSPASYRKRLSQRYL
jgi:alkylation response protein AidB-like acyl-CoA dehydrogenase